MTLFASSFHLLIILWCKISWSINNAVFFLIGTSNFPTGLYIFWIKNDWTIDSPFQLFLKLKSTILEMGRLVILFMTYISLESSEMFCIRFLILLFETSQVPVKGIASCLFLPFGVHVFNLSLINFDSQSLNKKELLPLKQRVVIDAIAARAKEQDDQRKSLTLYSFFPCFFGSQKYSF